MRYPHLLEALYHHLGRPAWYWPTVMAVLFVLIVLGTSIAPEVQP